MTHWGHYEQQCSRLASQILRPGQQLSFLIESD
jgi:hypothetical protein